MRGHQDGGPPLLYVLGISIIIHKHNNRQALVPHIGNMAATVIAVNTEEDVHGYIRIKNPVGKSLGCNIAPSPHCPLSLWPSREGSSLVWDFLVLEDPYSLHREMREAQNTSYMPGMNPSPVEADERAPSRCTIPIPFLCDPRAPQLLLWFLVLLLRKSFRSYFSS